MTADALPVVTSTGDATSIEAGSIASTGVVAATALHRSVTGCASTCPVSVATYSDAACNPGVRGVHATAIDASPPGASGAIVASQNAPGRVHGNAKPKLPSRSLVCRNSSRIVALPAL